MVAARERKVMVAKVWRIVWKKGPPLKLVCLIVVVELELALLITADSELELAFLNTADSG